MANTVSVALQIDEILIDYTGKLRMRTSQANRAIAKEAVQKLKNTSPKGSPHRRKYAEGWTTKTQRNRSGITDIIVWNSTNYQLTHLLENGHVIRNKKGTYGRTRGIKHIAPVEDWAIDELPKEIERRMER